MNIAWIVAGCVVGVLIVVFVARDWSNNLRRIKVLWFIRGRVVASFLAVYVLGAAPIGAHLFAVQANEQASNTTSEYWPVVIADVYLYAFIIALAGVVDALTAGQTATAFVFFALALITGFGNYNGMLDVVVKHQIGNWLAIPVWAVLVVTAIGYAWFKALTLYAAGAEDWEEEKARSARKRGTSP